jgi:hypothetical protein
MPLVNISFACGHCGHKQTKQAKSKRVKEATKVPILSTPRTALVRCEKCDRDQYVPINRMRV